MTKTLRSSSFCPEIETETKLADLTRHLVFFVLTRGDDQSASGPNGIPGIPGSRDFQLIKIPGFWKMESRDFSGSAYRV